MTDSNEMTISAYDVAVFEDQKLERKRRHERSVARWTQGSIAVGWIALASTILGVVFAIYQYNVGPSTKEELEHREKLECIAVEGTWVKLSESGSTTGYGTCLHGRTQ